MGRYTTGIMSAVLIIFGLLVFFGILTREQPAEEMEITLTVDPKDGVTTETAVRNVFPYTPGSELATTDPAHQNDPYVPLEPEPIYRSIKGDPLFMKAGGAAPSGKWREIRVDENGYVICSPQPPKIYPWDIE